MEEDEDDEAASSPPEAVSSSASDELDAAVVGCFNSFSSSIGDVDDFLPTPTSSRLVENSRLFIVYFDVCFLCCCCFDLDFRWL